MFNISGTALGAVIPPFILKAEEDNESISNGLRLMQISYGVVTGVVFILVLVCRYCFVII